MVSTGPTLAVAMPTDIQYPADLPISSRRSEIADAIRDHQVVIVAGETGSGKSTQLPKICLELGRSEQGWIGHTQPRRIAARAVAERVADELKTSIGELVGYKVRFDDKVSASTAIKTMTDGILLNELQHDRLLKKYSTLIIDEAHERSLNIDFLLGCVHDLLPQRPDLRVIVTSATIDTARFSEFFNDAPVVEVSGRGYPVEVRYRPQEDLDTGEALTQAESIVEGVRETCRSGRGDVLIFCSGEREIREASEALTKASGTELGEPIEVLQLFGRLSASEQHRIFDPGRNSRRRVIVATNVAETSLTVPNITYVIDAGTARISRYSNRTKVQRLPIEKISQASANQRSGRCGRIGPGVCLRLYSEEDFLDRAEFTEPEITRTNLASVLLQMASLGLRDIESFPFLDAPDQRQIRDGIALLEELGAVAPGRRGEKGWVTEIGRQLVRLPVDPRYGRMLIEAEAMGCLDELITIVAALSIRDPKVRPEDKRDKAAEAHRQFRVEGSDFMAWLELWRQAEAERAARSSGQFRKWCIAHFLDYRRMREWQDLVRQLRRSAKSLRWQVGDLPEGSDADAVHRAALTGLLSHVGQRSPDGRDFLGARQARFVLSGGSALAKKPPRWVMAAELVETNRLWAHTAGTLQPGWIETAGKHLMKWSFTDPEWDTERAAAMCVARATLYGIAVVPGKRVNYRQVDREVARGEFINHALVQGEWENEHEFFAQNEAVLSEIHQMGAATRRDITVEHDRLFSFFDQRVGPKVTSGHEFDVWWRKRRKSDPTLLDLAIDDLLDTEPRSDDEEDFPETWEVAGAEVPVSYTFDEGAIDDGLTIDVPIALLSHVDTTELAWGAPGSRRELVTELIRSLPKEVRKRFVPVPDTVEVVLEDLDTTQQPVESVRKALARFDGAPIDADAFDLDKIPLHLRPRIRVVDEDGRELASGRELSAVQQQLDADVQVALSKQSELTSTGSTTWEFATLPRSSVTVIHGREVTAFPALKDEGDSVGVVLCASEDEQWQTTWNGTVRLLRRNVGGAARHLAPLLTRETDAAIRVGPYATKVAWVNDVSDAVFAWLLKQNGGPVWDHASWEGLVDAVRSQLPEAFEHFGPLAVDSLHLGARLVVELQEGANEALRPARTDMANHLDRLFYAGYATGVGADKFADVVRYLKGIEARLLRLPDRLTADARSMIDCLDLEQELDRRVGDGSGAVAADVEAVVWMLEEYRIASFAQDLGVHGKVSRKRLRTALAKL